MLKVINIFLNILDLLDCNNLTVSEEAEIKSLLSKMLTSEEKLNEQIKKYCPEFNMS